MNFSISTAWLPDHPARSVIERLERLSPPAIALGPNLFPATLERLRRARASADNPSRRGLPVAAVWLYAARPEALPLEAEPGAALPLLTLDREMRGRALEQALRSFFLAAELEVTRLVCPLWREATSAPRERLLDAARSILEPMLEEAARRSLRLAIPLADEDEELPSREELLALLAEFRGAPIAYWHSARHTPERSQTNSPLESRTPGGLILLVPAAAPPPPKPPEPPLPEDLEPHCAGAEARLSPPDPEEERWPEGDWARRLAGALKERPLVYTPAPGQSEEEVSRVLGALSSPRSSRN